jgi:hypothetical protein
VIVAQVHVAAPHRTAVHHGSQLETKTHWQVQATDLHVRYRRYVLEPSERRDAVRDRCQGIVAQVQPAAPHRWHAPVIAQGGGRTSA